MVFQPFTPRFDGGYRPLDEDELQRVIEVCSRAWLNEPLCRTQGCTLTVMELKGEYIWHKHDNHDEAFHVISGTLLIAFEDRVEELQTGQSINIPAGALHRPKARERAVVLVVEGSQSALKNS